MLQISFIPSQHHKDEASDDSDSQQEPGPLKHDKKASNDTVAIDASDDTVKASSQEHEEEMSHSNQPESGTLKHDKTSASQEIVIGRELEQ